MHQIPIPILAKAPVYGLLVNVARSGLCIGDSAYLSFDSSRKVIVSATVRQRFLGLFPRLRPSHLGHLGPIVDLIVVPMLEEGRDLRVRIVGITPEHLCGAHGPEVFVSIWGAPKPIRRLI